MSDDNWKHRAPSMRCRSCMYFVEKQPTEPVKPVLGRCRRHAPTMAGWPVMFPDDWCGDHKLDENKLPMNVDVLTGPKIMKPEPPICDWKDA
jgi:hypothetical protein